MRDKQTPKDVCGEANLTRKAPSTVFDESQTSHDCCDGSLILTREFHCLSYPGIRFTLHD